MGFITRRGATSHGGRWRAVMTACAALAVMAAGHAVVPQDAQAAVELDRRVKSTQTDYDPTKMVRADCPGGTHVLGGGGVIRDGGEDIARFTGLFPTGRNDSGGGPYPSPDGFTASAETVFQGQYAPWSLTAYAICSDRDNFDDFSIEIEQNDNANSATFVSGTARCPAGTVAYSAGGQIVYPWGDRKGRVGLQMIRTSGPLDIARATARENTPLNTPNVWPLLTYAVCASEERNVHVEGAGDPDGDQLATSTCRDGMYVHGAGGGASGPGVTDAGPSWLKAIVPSDTLRKVDVSMAGSAAPIGGVVTSHTCARHPGL